MLLANKHLFPTFTFTGQSERGKKDDRRNPVKCVVGKETIATVHHNNRLFRYRSL